MGAKDGRAGFFPSESRCSVKRRRDASSGEDRDGYAQCDSYVLEMSIPIVCVSVIIVLRSKKLGKKEIFLFLRETRNWEKGDTELQKVLIYQGF